LKAAIQKLIREDNFLSLSGNLTISFLGIAGFAILTRTLRVDLFGQWIIYGAAGTFIEMLRFGITNTAVIRYLSGSMHEDRMKYIGSNALIGLIATIIISLIIVICHLLFPVPIKNAGYELFFNYYPMMAFLTLPINTALVIMQAIRNLEKYSL